MNQLAEAAAAYLRMGLSILPLTKDKSPAIAGWKQYEETAMSLEEVEQHFKFRNVVGLGIICGAVSRNLEVIDVDTKHDTTGKLWQDFGQMIKDNLPEEVRRSLVVAETRTKGYHIYYRCAEISRNEKIAKNGGTPNEVIIETRGSGGYVAAWPMEGYRFIQGSPATIPTISIEHRSLLFDIARTFDKTPPAPEVKYTPKKSNPQFNDIGKLTAMQDYNQRGQDHMFEVLAKHGYRIVDHSGDRIHILRPGDTDSKHSGDFHEGLNKLKMFSTSTQFEAEKGYSPADVFKILECGGDAAKASLMLWELGYGTRTKSKR